MYIAVQVLYQFLSTLCVCYCSSPVHAKDILPAIVLGLHFLVLNNSLLLMSYEPSETMDKPAMAFAAACAPFFSLFRALHRGGVRGDGGRGGPLRGERRVLRLRGRGHSGRHSGERVGAA